MHSCLSFLIVECIYAILFFFVCGHIVIKIIKQFWQLYPNLWLFLPIMTVLFKHCCPWILCENHTSERFRLASCIKKFPVPSYQWQFVPFAWALLILPFNVGLSRFEFFFQRGIFVIIVFSHNFNRCMAPFLFIFLIGYFSELDHI